MRLRRLAAGALVLASGCGAGATGAATPAIAVPDDFPALRAPDDNAPTPARIALGRRLFFDPRLSRTREVSCASCHLQENAFADPRRFSVGVDGKLGTRNAPALINQAWGTSFFWHGGAPTLEAQAVGPIQNPLEMDMTLPAVAARLEADPVIASAFRAAYQQPATADTIPRALASFVRSLVSADSRSDRFERGDATALSEAEQRGRAILFGERGECFHCHVGWNLTNDGFRNNGIEPTDPDLGRAEITGKDSDVGKFKIPTLRNIAVTAPYMHDGGLATLEDVIEQYDRGGRGYPNTDPTIHALGLTEQEKADLAAFLRALTDETFLTDTRFAAPSR